jgi:hypothetical protein
VNLPGWVHALNHILFDNKIAINHELSYHVRRYLNAGQDESQERKSRQHTVPQHLETSITFFQPTTLAAAAIAIYVALNVASNYKNNLHAPKPSTK